MKKAILVSFIALVVVFYSGIASANPGHYGNRIHVHTIGEVDKNGNTVDLDSLVEKLQGGGITIEPSSMQYYGVDGASGIFENRYYYPGYNGPIQMQDGVVLSTGYAKLAELESNGDSSVGRNNNYELTDPSMEFLEAFSDELGLGGRETHDESMLRFVFTTTNPLLCVQYLFASEEYNHFMAGAYNDVFAFFVREYPDGEWRNIALVPQETDPVTVKSINCDSNSDYFVNNDIWDDNAYDPMGDAPHCAAPVTTYDFEYDGFTKPMCADDFDIIPAQQYEIVIAIGDTQDYGFDSAIFIDEVTDEPHSLTIVTTELDSQTVGTFYSQNLQALGSTYLPYSWSIKSITLSAGLPSTVIGDLNIQAAANSTFGLLTWTLPVVPEGEFVDIVFEVVDSFDTSICDQFDNNDYDEDFFEKCVQSHTAEATFTYTDPPVGSVTSGGGASAGGGGGCFISSAANGSNLDLNPGIAFLLLGFAALPVIYRKLKK